MAMSLPYRKRHVSIRMQRRGIGRWKQKGNYERDRDRERQIDRERKRERERGEKEEGRQEILQRKAIATKSFSSRERHVHVVGVFSAPYPAYKTYSR